MFKRRKEKKKEGKKERKKERKKDLFSIAGIEKRNIWRRRQEGIFGGGY